MIKFMIKLFGLLRVDCSTVYTDTKLIMLFCDFKTKSNRIGSIVSMIVIDMITITHKKSFERNNDNTIAQSRTKKHILFPPPRDMV